MLASDLRSEDDKVWYRISKDMRTSIVLLHKDYFLTLLMTAGIENYRKYIAMYRPVVFAIEYYYRKPLKECSLMEVVDCILINSRVMNVAEDISYKDKGDYYELIIVHSFGITMSKCTSSPMRMRLRLTGQNSRAITRNGLFLSRYSKMVINVVPG